MMQMIHLALTALPAFASAWLLARGGGGGSESSGGFSSSGSDFSSGSDYSSGSSTSGSTGNIWFLVIFLIVFVLIFAVPLIIGFRQRRRPLVTEHSDDPLTQRVHEVFMAYQAAWSKLDVEAMEPYVAASYRDRSRLELAALAALGRENRVENPVILSIQVTTHPETEADGTRFMAIIMAQASDQLRVHATNQLLYEDMSQFTEYWTFVHEEGAWKLELIEQSTEAPSKLVQSLEAFARTNSFYYDGDFGWLLMPDHGVLFGDSNFTTSDINNHVIGERSGHVVELYTFVPRKGEGLSGEQWTVAQTTLPKSYRDILIKRRKTIQSAPKGLREIKLESNDFNKRFVLWADPSDSISSLELLNPQFMERIYGFPFELNIEIVGSYLYFFTKDRAAKYDDMLQVLDWAFDELKR